MSRMRFSLARRRAAQALAGTVAVALSAGLGGAVTQQSAAAAPRAGTMSESFRVATFNVLGASHTETGRRGFDGYQPRMRRMIGLFERRGLDVVGMQEYQWPQHELFKKLTGSTWGVYPGTELGRGPSQNSIAWRNAEWTLVEKHMYKIPYFYGKLVAQPYIKLRSTRSGHEIWVINTHNPADARGPAQHWRDQAIAIQAELANRLERTGRPVFLTGDFNDREDAFCDLTAASNLTAANGGYWYGGVCRPPSKMKIDWIFLSKSARVHSYTHWDNHVTDSISDHPLIYSDVSVPLS